MICDMISDMMCDMMSAKPEAHELHMQRKGMMARSFRFAVFHRLGRSKRQEGWC
jgi:hypothetical protein